MRNILCWLGSISAALILASCEPVVDTRGHAIEEMDFSQVVTGQTTMEDVRALFGSPSARSTFGDPVWFYISERKETYAFYAPEVADQKVLAIYFDPNQTVRDMERYDLKDGKKIVLVERQTPTAGHSLTFMEQLMGNFGRFNAPSRGIDSRNMGR